MIPNPKCDCSCLIGEDKFSANDDRPHAGWTFRPDIRDTDAGDEPENSSGTFNFSAPAVEIFDTPHPGGTDQQQHAQAKFLISGSDGGAVDLFLGYTDDDSVVYVRVRIPAAADGEDGDLDSAEFFGARHDFIGFPAGTIGDKWTCPERVRKAFVAIGAPGHNGAAGTAGTPAGGLGGGGGAWAQSVDVPLRPGVNYQTDTGVFGDPLSGDPLVSAEPGGMHAGLGNERFGGHASHSIGDLKYSGGDGTAKGAVGGQGGGGGGGANYDGNGTNASGRIGGTLQAPGGDGGASTTDPASNGSDAAPDSTGGGGGGASGPTSAGTGGLGGTGEIYLEFYQAAEPLCGHLEFRIRDGNGDYEIDPDYRVPVEIAEAEWFTVDACLIRGNDYGYGSTWYLRGKATTEANPSGRGGQVRLHNFTPGAKAGLGFGVGSGKADDFHFTFFREDPSHATCPNCNSQCFVGSDDFEVELAADDFNQLGCDWLIESGSAVQTGGQLLTDGRVKYLVPHPTNKSTKWVLVEFDVDAGDKPYIDIMSGKAVIDVDAGKLELYDSDGTLVGSADGSFSGFVALTVCYDGIFLSAMAGAAFVRSFGNSPSSDPYVYLGTEAGAVAANSFRFEKAYSAVDPKDLGCAQCPRPPVDCQCCDPDKLPPDSLVVDFGAGGLVTRAPSSCTACEAVSGEIVVDFVDSCTWVGFIGSCDDVPLLQCGGFARAFSTSYDIYVYVYLYLALDGTCRWRANLSGGGTYVQDPTDPKCRVGGYGYWESDPIDRPDCTIFPITLTKVGGTTDPCAATIPEIEKGFCCGILPDTITLDNV